VAPAFQGVTTSQKITAETPRHGKKKGEFARISGKVVIWGGGAGHLTLDGMTTNKACEWQAGFYKKWMKGGGRDGLEMGV